MKKTKTKLSKYRHEKLKECDNRRNRGKNVVLSKKSTIVIKISRWEIFLKVALQVLGWHFTKIVKKSPLSLLIFIHRTSVVERHPITRELDIYYGRGWHHRETRSIFTWAARSFTHWKYTDEPSNIAVDEDIMENNCMLMLWNLSVIRHWSFPQYFFFFNFWRQI